MNECLLVQRQRLVSTALVSDGGWCLFGGDEFGKQMPVSVFLNQDEKPMYNDVYFFNEAKQQAKSHHTGLIKGINAAIDDMPRAVFPHWAKVLNLPSNLPFFDRHLVIVMNFNGEGFSDPQPVLTIVNLTSKPIQMFDAFIEQIAAEFKFSQGDNLQAFESVLRAKKQLIGNFDIRLLKKYEVVVYYHPETIDVDNATMLLKMDLQYEARLWESSDFPKASEHEAMLWESDRQQAVKDQISLSIAQLRNLSIFKQKIIGQTAKHGTAYQKNEASHEGVACENNGVLLPVCDVDEENETLSECDAYDEASSESYAHRLH